MATKIKKTITKKPKGELNRGQGLPTGGTSTGGGAGRAYVQKKHNQEINKGIAKAGLRLATAGLSSFVEPSVEKAVAKAKAKKAVKRASKK